MKPDVLYLVRCNFGRYSFRLLWNGAAMFAWRSTELERAEIAAYSPEATCKMLAILGREAAAWCRTHGYEPDEVPTEEQLLEYYKGQDIMPYEMNDIMRSISIALQCGDHQDYKPPEDDSVDIDTIELKKN